MQKIRKKYRKKIDFCNVHEFCVKAMGNGGRFPEKCFFREEKTENCRFVKHIGQ